MHLASRFYKIRLCALIKFLLYTFFKFIISFTILFSDVYFPSFLFFCELQRQITWITTHLSISIIAAYVAPAVIMSYSCPWGLLWWELRYTLITCTIPSSTPNHPLLSRPPLQHCCCGVGEGSNAAPHSEHRFPAVSSKLSHNCRSCHWKGTLHLRAVVHRRCRRPPKGLGSNKTVEAA